MAQGLQSYSDATRRQRTSPQERAAWSWAGSAPLNASGQIVQWISVSGFVVFQTAASLSVFGHYLGWTITGTDVPWDLSGIAVEYDLGREW
jgi:hypothetical protein